MTKQYATRQQQRQIEELLREHCRKEHGQAVYEDGWDDYRIADEVGVTKNNVQGIRMEDYGQLRRGRPTADEAIESATIQALGDAIQAQIITIATISNRLDLALTRIRNLEESVAALRVQVTVGSAATVLGTNGVPADFVE